MCFLHGFTRHYHYHVEMVNFAQLIKDTLYHTTRLMQFFTTKHWTKTWNYYGSCIIFWCCTLHGMDKDTQCTYIVTITIVTITHNLSVAVTIAVWCKISIPFDLHLCMNFFKLKTAAIHDVSILLVLHILLDACHTPCV